VHVVCIHPGLSTNLLFDAKLARVELAGRDRFRVMEGDAGLALVPTEALTEGERVPVTVYFQDGAAPASATFNLVVHPFEAERQVEVTRHPRTLASYREGEQQARAELQQCRGEKAILQAKCAGQVGLTGLLAQGLLGEGGVAAKNIKVDLAASPGNTLTYTEAHSYRSDTARGKSRPQAVRLAVALELWNTGAQPWTPASAVLVSPQHAELKALGMWPLEPIPSGKSHRVVVEVEATAGEARGPFTLELWSQEGGARSERFDGVTFP
jgi:uncharacterized protein (TIGR02268 family)